MFLWKVSFVAALFAAIGSFIKKGKKEFCFPTSSEALLAASKAENKKNYI